MKITVEFLSLPNVVRMVGSKTITFDFDGQTVEDLIQEIARKYGEDVRRFLLDDTGHLDMTFGVMINKQEWVRRNQMDRSLEDGDQVTLLMLAGGG